MYEEPNLRQAVSNDEVIAELIRLREHDRREADHLERELRAEIRELWLHLPARPSVPWLQRVFCRR